MRLALAIIALIVMSASSIAADDLPEHVLNLSKIRRRMAEHLNRLPNYTCLETLERRVAHGSGKWRPLDLIHVDVAVVDGRELYSWPGKQSFDDRSVVEMVKGGLISDGDFASM